MWRHWFSLSRSRRGVGVGMRDVERFLEQWEMDVSDLRRRLLWAPKLRERERWYAL